MKIGTNRVEAFSDGVMAIILTIMMLELKLPDLNKHISTKDIWNLIIHLSPYLITYAFSFMMIAIFWTNHHHMFHLLEKTDEKLLWQNFIFLFFLSLIPFATAIIGSNPFVPVAPAIYGFVMLLTTSSFTAMRNYTIRKKLIHKDSNRELTVHIFRASLSGRKKAIAGTIVYLASMPLAYVNVWIAYVCFIIPPIIFFVPQGIDNEELAEKVSEKNV